MTHGDRSSSAERLSLFVGLLGLVGILLGIAYIPSEALEDRLLDARFRMRSNAPAGHPDLLLVALDEKFAARHDYPTVTPRGYLARVIETSSRSGARVIALDIALVAPDTLNPEFAGLRSALAAAPSAVFPSLLSVHGTRAATAPLFDLAAEPSVSLRPLGPSGFVTFVDGTRPRMRLLARLEDRTLAASFAFRAVQSHLGLVDPAPATWRRDGGSIRVSEPAANAVLDELGLPALIGEADDGPAAGPINFVGPIGLGSDIGYLSSEDLLSLYESNPALGQATLGGKLVVVGAMHAGAQDRSFESPWGPMYGVEVQANVINSLLTREFLRDWSGAGPRMALALIGLLCAVAGALAFARARSDPVALFVGPLVAIAFPLVLTVAAFAFFDAPRGTIIPMALPLKAWLFGGVAAFSVAAYRGRPGVAGEAVQAGAASAAPVAAEAPAPAPESIPEPQAPAPERRIDSPSEDESEKGQASRSTLALIAGSIALILVSMTKGRKRDDQDPL